MFVNKTPNSTSQQNVDNADTVLVVINMSRKIFP